VLPFRKPTFLSISIDIFLYRVLCSCSLPGSSPSIPPVHSRNTFQPSISQRYNTPLSF
jgi:hypothetical protein